MISIKKYIMKFLNYHHSKLNVCIGMKSLREIPIHLKSKVFFFFYNIIFALYFDIATYILTILHMEYNIASLTLSEKVIFLNP